MPSMEMDASDLFWPIGPQSYPFPSSLPPHDTAHPIDKRRSSWAPEKHPSAGELSLPGSSMAAAKLLLRPLLPCASSPQPGPIQIPHRLISRANIAGQSDRARSPRPCCSSVNRRRQLPTTLPRASGSGGNAPDGGEDGVSLGTMKLPRDTDLPRFELLLFQWANSLCQGASVPLPVPLKVDRLEGGARLGFVKMGDAGVEVPVYIDCLVFPADGATGSRPIFRATRHGALKDQVAPGEERIMRSLLQALQISVEIARV